MAETLLSPGTLARENDQSQISSQPIQVGAAIVGPTVKGKPNIPTLITTYSEYSAVFGNSFTSASNEYSFLTSISAYNYFANGGASLLVTRIVSGSYSPATSSDVDPGTGLLTATNELSASISGTFNITGSTGGTTLNVGLTGSVSGSGGIATIVLADSESLTSITVTTPGTTYIATETITIPSASLGATTDGGDNMVLELTASDLQSSLSSSFTLETLGEGVIVNSTSSETTTGALASGSENNIRWEITNADTTRGVFSLLVRRGDDNTRTKSVLETFTNLSLDPKSSNYIGRIIGDQTQTLMGSGTADPYLQTTGSYLNGSRFVRVKEVFYKTPDYFDNDGNAKAAYIQYIPTAQSGTFGDATGDIKAGANMYENINNSNTQGVVADNYDDAFNLLKSKGFGFEVITAPGLIYSNATHDPKLDTLIENIENKGDAIIPIDLENYGSTVTATITTARSLDTSYAAAYWPWLQITDPDTGQLVWVPASTLIPGVYAYNDKSAEPWFAPAGTSRGGLTIVRQAERKLTQTNKDDLYLGKVNPLATLPGKGVVIFGQKTLQTKPSALDRINVRRLLIELKSHITQVADNLVFEPNTAATRNNFLAQVNPYLESIQQRQGLYTFKVIMDDTNNTSDIIDRNELIGQIYIQPTRTAEYIYLDFNILPTGATFPV